MTVPSCKNCNLGASLDEEYFRLKVIGLLCHTPEADQLFDGAASRSMDRLPYLEDLMFGQLYVEGKSVYVEVDDRIQRVAIKIVRGLEYLATGKTFTKTTRFGVEIIDAFGDGFSDNQLAPDFTFEALASSLGWTFSFFNCVTFRVTAIQQ